MAGCGTGPVAILAGAGLLPLALAQRLKSEGRDCRILAFRGFADKAVAGQADKILDLLDVRGILACLQAWQVQSVVLAGAVRRPRASALLGSFSLLLNRRELKEIVARGDDHLLRGAVSLLEDKGFKVLGAHEIIPDITCSEGIFTRRQPVEAEHKVIAHSLDLLDNLSRFDIGQGVVTSNLHILAIEGPEGTDRMLRRVAAQHKRGLFSRKITPFPNSVLVKTAKVGQDLRIDMPAIGPRTVREAAKAGIGGIAVGVGRTLILDQEETIREADRHNMFLIGIAVE